MPVMLISPSLKTCTDAHGRVNRAPSQLLVSEPTAKQNGQKRENLVYIGSLVLHCALKSFLYGKVIQITEDLHGCNKQHWWAKKPKTKQKVNSPGDTKCKERQGMWNKSRMLLLLFLLASDTWIMNDAEREKERRATLLSTLYSVFCTSTQSSKAKLYFLLAIFV